VSGGLPALQPGPGRDPKAKPFYPAGSVVRRPAWIPDAGGGGAGGGAFGVGDRVPAGAVPGFAGLLPGIPQQGAAPCHLRDLDPGRPEGEGVVPLVCQGGGGGCAPDPPVRLLSVYAAGGF